MMHGARAALGKAAGKQDPRSLWLGIRQKEREDRVWAMLSGGTFYEPHRR